MELSHQPCPNCNSSDAFSFNVEKGVGKCFSCSEPYPKRGVKYDEETLAKYPLKGAVEPTERPVSGSMKFVGMRGIDAQTMEAYGVLTRVVDGKPVAQEYTYPSGGVKVRSLPHKGFSVRGAFKSDELFGMNLFTLGSSKRLTITEGELDALSAYQMLGGSSGRYENVVVSLPSASPSKNLWANVKDWVDAFEEIILSVDNDERGNEIAEKINNLWPNKVRRVDHGKYKDANEFLQAGKGAEFKSAWWNAPKYVPDNVLHSSSDLLELFDKQENHIYVPTGIAEFDAKAMGLMQGHFTVFKAPTGIGKTELMRFLEWNFLQKGVSFATMHLEETKLRSVLGLVSYDLGDNLTRKDLVEGKGRVDDVRESIKRLGDSELYYQYFLKDGQGEEELIANIRLFKEAYGCRFVLFEPIQDVISVSSEENKESRLAELAVRLSKVAADLNVGIVTIAHTNEDGDVKYCKMIGQRASMIVRLDRDKDAEDEVDRNTTRLYIEKNRPTSEEGYAGSMLFDGKSFTMGAI